MATVQVVLADGPVHSQRVLGHVGGERAVGPVDAVVGATVHDDRQLGRWHGNGFHPADRADLTGARNEERGLAARVGEQAGLVDTSGRAAGRQFLRADGAVEFAERPLVPAARVLDVDDVSDGGGPGRGDAAVADDAYVNDARREFAGTGAIRRWVAKEMVGDKVSIDVREVLDHHGDTIVRGAYDGTFDKTGLPEELILSNYFSVRDGKIVSLIVILNHPADY
jgi:hypothetical protein